ncbi:MAG: ABC transporter ATP-binding protein [Methanocalculaceae archaeon]|jgi:iron complex transport system ATP-binding protein|nr:ABC transporter ATP-binding protein [Methanocalculaceae archaeon]
MTPVISAEHLSVSYGDHKVLADISLGVEEGQFIGILGPNGCGKTTFLQTLSRVFAPDAGGVMVEGQDISAYDTKELAKILGCMRQETDAAFPFTVREIVLMGRYPHIRRLAPLAEADLVIANEAMKTTNTLHLADRLITEISGGEQQRVLIARLLAQQPKILLLDEPTSHLDISHQIEILNMLRDLTPKITVISVFHDFNLASYFCDRLVLMSGGGIIATGAPAKVLTAERLLESFHVRMLVNMHPLTGKPYLIPEYGTTATPAAQHVHVMSGGGTGVVLFHLLLLHGCRVTAGVLAANDSDAAAAAALGIEAVVEPPFVAVSEASVRRLKLLLFDADAVVVAAMPIGFGNLSNLSILLETDVPVYFLGKCEDFADGRADVLRARLCECGAVEMSEITDFLRRIV